MSSSPSWLSYLATHCPLSLSLSLLLSVVRLSAADHLSSAPPSRLAARLPPIIIFNSPWWSASPPSVVLFFSPPFLFVRWSPSSSSLNIRERKKKKRRKERKEKMVGNIIATFLHFAAFWKIRTWRGEKLEPWWAGCQSSSLTNSGWNGERYHWFRWFFFLFFFEDKRFLLDCALLICLMAE